MSSRGDGLAFEHRPAGQQRRDVGGEVLGDEGPQLLDRDRPVLVHPEPVPADHPQPERVVVRGAGQAVALMLRVDVAHDDVGVPEFGAAPHRVQAVDEHLVAAPVHPEREPPILGGVRGLEVGDDVAATERVDGLLRVADQNHRRVTAERPVDDLPLHGVGVLELVDHHDRPALPHPVPRRRLFALKGFGEPAQQVVVAKHAHPPLAVLQFGDDLVGEGQPGRRVGVRLRVLRAQLRTRIADDGTGQRERFPVRHRRVVVLLREVGKVDVVDDLDHQIVKALHQRDSGIGIAGYAKRFQHQAAELVGGRDGRGVEAAQRVAQTGQPLSTVLGRASQQMLDKIGRLGGPILEGRRGLHDLAADPLAQFAAGGPAERDQQHLVQRRDALGQVAGDQTGQRERLTRTRAGLQHGGGARGRQIAQQVEALHQSILRSASRTGSHRRRASAPNRVSSPSTRSPDRGESLSSTENFDSGTPHPDVGAVVALGSDAVLPLVAGIGDGVAPAVALLGPRARRLQRQREGFAAPGVEDRHEAVQHRHRIRRQAEHSRRDLAAARRGRCTPPRSRVRQRRGPPARSMPAECVSAPTANR